MTLIKVTYKTVIWCDPCHNCCRFCLHSADLAGRFSDFALVGVNFKHLFENFKFICHHSNFFLSTFYSYMITDLPKWESGAVTVDFVRVSKTAGVCGQFKKKWSNNVYPPMHRTGINLWLSVQISNPHRVVV